MALGAGTALWAVLDKPAQLPARADLPVRPYFFSDASVPIGSLLPSAALQKLQWLADEASCQVSDNAALMAGCVRERISKVRVKAKLYKAKYEAIVNLEQEYFWRLAQAGLVPETRHVPKDRLETDALR